MVAGVVIVSDVVAAVVVIPPPTLGSDPRRLVRSDVTDLDGLHRRKIRI